MMNVINRLTVFFAIAGVIPSVSAQSCAEDQFPIRRISVIGGDVYSIANADIDMDGYSDTVVGHYSLGITVFFGNAEGGHERVELASSIGGSYASVALADMNGDGLLDIVDSRREQVGVLLQTATRDFAQLPPVLVPGNDTSLNFMKVADLDSDGDVDILRTVRGHGRVDVFRNDGSGALELHESIEPEAGVSQVQAGDINLDGLPDLLITYVAYGDMTASVYLNSPEGFTLHEQFEDASVATLIDWTGDGASDLVLFYADSPIARVRGWNSGSGSTSLLYELPAETRPGALAIEDVGDVDDDGDLDIVYVNEDADSFTVVRNNGDLLPVIKSYENGLASSCITIGDYDGDAFIDVLVGNGRFQEDFSIFRGVAPGGVYEDFQLYITGGAPIDAAIEDLDGDGDNDIAVARWNSEYVAVLHNTGFGGFASPQFVFMDTGSRQVIVGDINGDSAPDIVSLRKGSGSRVSVALHDSNGDYLYPQLYDTGTEIDDIDLGDIDNDGDLDVVLFGDEAKVLRNPGDGQLEPAVQLVGTGGHYSGSVLTDLNGDGYLDILNPFWTGFIPNLNQQDGTFKQTQVYDGLPSGIRRAVPADIDHDGDQDLVIPASATNQLFIYLNDGLASFILYAEINTIYGVGELEVIDIDQDGDLDFVGEADNGSFFAMYQNKGSYSSPRFYGTIGTSSVSAALINNDDLPDIVTVGLNEQGVAISFSQCAALPCTGDLNGSGQIDFFDLGLLIGYFNGGDLLADLNNDGLLNFFDISLFIELYQAGCP